jgi:protein-disulfide isomerase
LIPDAASLLCKENKGDAVTIANRLFGFTGAFFAAILMVSSTNAAPKKVIKSNWLSTVTVSSEGGHVIGNPNAPIKLIEYASYTCGHCGSFETTDAPILRRDYIAQGTVSLEIRPFLLNALDVPVTLLANCGTPGKFYGTHNSLMTRQKSWIANADKISSATKAKLDKPDFAGFNIDVYNALQLNNLAKERGLTEAVVQKCLSDAGKIEKIIAITDNAAQKLNVRGTPSFFVNGALKEDAHTIETLKPYLTVK